MVDCQLLIMGIILAEIFVEYFKLMTKRKKYSFITAIESALIRASNDLGRFIRNVKRKNFKGICQRFDYFCDGKHIKHERFWAFSKFLSHIIVSLLFIIIFILTIN